MCALVLYLVDGKNELSLLSYNVFNVLSLMLGYKLQSLGNTTRRLAQRARQDVLGAQASEVTYRRVVAIIDELSQYCGFCA